MSPLLFDGADLCVRGQWPFPGRPFVVSFGNHSDGKVPVQGFGEAMFLQRRFNFACFIAKRNHWWHTPELAGAVRESGLREALQAFPDVVTYGSSMGGHGALMAAPLVGARRVVALVPQFSLHRPDLPLHPAWRLDMAAVPELLRFDACWARQCEITVIHDPFCRQDSAHVAALCEVARVRRVRVPLAGHLVAQMLKSAGLLGTTIERLLDGSFDPATFVHAWRTRRRSVFDYWFGLAREAESRPAVRRAAQQRALDLGLELIRSGGAEVSHKRLVALVGAHCAELVATGHGDEAEALAATYAGNYPRHVFGHLVVAAVALQRQHWAAADAAALQALRIRSANVQALLVRAEVALRTRCWHQAGQLLETALRSGVGKEEHWAPVARLVADCPHVDAPLRGAVAERLRQFAP